jgi:hypothetical protein
MYQQTSTEIPKSMQLTINFNQPLRSGVFEGVQWRSGTTLGEAQSFVLEWMLKKTNFKRHLKGMKPATVNEMLLDKFGLTLFEWKRDLFTPQLFYKAKTEYRNNQRVWHLH